MPNKNYNRGVRYEREMVNTARSLGGIAFRSAGSHSKYDVVVFFPKDNHLRFIQMKAHKAKKKYSHYPYFDTRLIRKHDRVTVTEEFQNIYTK